MATELPGSLSHNKLSPIAGVQISLYIWWPCTQLLTEYCSIDPAELIGTWLTRNGLYLEFHQIKIHQMQKFADFQIFPLYGISSTAAPIDFTCNLTSVEF